MHGRHLTGIRVVEQPLSSLPEYGSVPSTFLVRSVLDVQPLQQGLGGWVITDRPLATPYEKTTTRPRRPRAGQSTSTCPYWTIFAAYADGNPERVGGAVLAWRTPGVHMLEGRDDLAVLWDIRVQPAARGRGIGHALFAARQRRCRWLKIETQNTNVPACRFYARQGCELRGIHRHMYAAFPDELQLLWYYDL